MHVFWDVDGLHPGKHDPRVLAARIQRFAQQYGTVVGLYAYAPRKAWNWVPEALLQYGGLPQEKDVQYRCPLCGTIKRTRQELEAHTAAAHGQTIEKGSRISTQPQDGAAQADVLATRNSSNRTLGRVSLYHTFHGHALVPPAGHQLSLKYCLTKEGWEVSGPLCYMP